MLDGAPQVYMKRRCPAISVPRRHPRSRKSIKDLSGFPPSERNPAGKHRRPAAVAPRESPAPFLCRFEKHRFAGEA
jgi:hypothetical protein